MGFNSETFSQNPKLKNLKASTHTTPMRHTPMSRDARLVRYMPKRYTPNEIHAYEVHANEVHVQCDARLARYTPKTYTPNEIHAYEVHAHEIHTHEIHAHTMIGVGSTPPKTRGSSPNDKKKANCSKKPRRRMSPMLRDTTTMKLSA
jgi:hypothetical protein